MIMNRIENFTRGWLVGDFDPSLLKTKEIEVGLLPRKKDEDWPPHYHQYCDEYNVLVKGRMSIGHKEINEGDIFIISSGEITKARFHEDCTILCIKHPSVPGDKINVE